MKFKETTIKYLAGLFDADGSISLMKGTHNVQAVIQISQSVQGYPVIDLLCEEFGKNYSVCRKEGYRDTHLFPLCKLSHQRAFIDRICKYMVVKGFDFNWVISKVEELRGSRVSDKEFEDIKREREIHRHVGGSVKPISHVSDAWVAGFLDGDGHYENAKQKSVSVFATKTEKFVAMYYLREKLGGYCYESSKKGVGWRRNLGKQGKDFAVPFLTLMRKYSLIKKDKIKDLLDFHSGGTD